MSTDIASSLALTAVSGIGTIGYARLIQHFGSAQAVLAADAEQLHEQAEVRRSLATTIAATRPAASEQRRIDWAARNAAQIIPLEHPDYPPMLREIADPPSILFVRGNGLQRCVPAVGVVGSRRISPYGRQVTRAICRELAEWGITVVSGMALGVDGQAHRAALDGGGNTVAVLGTGLDQPYPPEHLELFRATAEHGAVITEFAPGTKPLAAHFPRRNRIISGLSLGVLVVEAQNGSGSLITARLAADQGREVYAVPGNIDQRGAQGTNALLRQGAGLITCARDLVADLLPQLLPPESAASHDAPPPPGLPKEAEKLWEMLTSLPLSIDHLAEQLAMDTARLLTLLLEMEMGGLVEKLPGNRYIRLP